MLMAAPLGADAVTRIDPANVGSSFSFRTFGHTELNKQALDGDPIVLDCFLQIAKPSLRNESSSM